jgi:predicted GIY-YIG superfamily endonuclease
MGYFVYILLSEKDGSFYIGQTNDVVDRPKKAQFRPRTLYKDKSAMESLLVG